MSEPNPDDIRFEDALAELEQVVRDLEDGQIGLEESLSRYERGVGLIEVHTAQDSGRSARSPPAAYQADRPPRR